MKRVAVPPDHELKAAASKLRRVAGDDPRVAEICNNVEEIAAGYTKRRGPFEPRPRPLHRLWKREPPERP
jgi:hypothetical protein